MTKFLNIEKKKHEAQHVSKGQALITWPLLDYSRVEEI